MMDPLILSHSAIVSAAGNGMDATLAALRAGHSGLRPCDFPGAEVQSHIGRVEGLETRPVRGDLAGYDCRNNRLAQMGLEADGFTAAVARAAARYGPDRIAVIMGSSTSGVEEGEQAYRKRRGPDAPLPAAFDFARTHDFYSLAAFVQAYLGLRGPSTVVSAACASSSKVFADAWQWITAGICDAAVVGGVDSLCLMTLRGFNALELLSRGPCRPNDAERTGLSIGEAAGFALLERPDAADGGDVALLGYGESSDAHHMSSPHPEGKGAIMAMTAALRRAGLPPDAIDYVNLHGTGTKANDRIEDRAVFETLGGAVPVSSTKAWTGHALGAAGIAEALICSLCLREGLIPQNLNLRRLDPAFRCAVQRETETRPIQRALSNSFGFGGSNCSLVLGRLP